MAIVYNGTVKGLREGLQPLKVQEHLGLLAGEQLFIALELVLRRGADPAITGFLFRWYQQEEIPRLLEAVEDATGPELTKRLVEYFGQHPGSARRWTEHVANEVADVSLSPSTLEDVLTEATILAQTPEASPALCTAYGVDEFYADEFRNVAPERAGLAVILAGHGLRPQLAYNTLLKLPPDTYPLFFRAAYLAANNPRRWDINVFAERFLRLYSHPSPITNISLPDPKVN